MSQPVSADTVAVAIPVVCRCYNSREIAGPVLPPSMPSSQVSLFT